MNQDILEAVMTDRGQRETEKAQIYLSKIQQQLEHISRLVGFSCALAVVITKSNEMKQCLVARLINILHSSRLSMIEHTLPSASLFAAAAVGT
jgi:hypothetical protein